MKQVFQEIRKQNRLKKFESSSGFGSSLHMTEIIRKQLKALIEKFQIESILDLGCGDCNWISRIDYDGLYRGIDVVPEYIEENQIKYKLKNNWFFSCIDVTNCSILEHDLIICRDVLVHLPEEEVFFMLDRIFHSTCKYFLSTTFPEHHENHNISPGGFYPINLQEPPFGLHEPLEFINEERRRRGNEYKDKSLGLWKIKNLTSLSPDVQDQEQP